MTRVAGVTTDDLRHMHGTYDLGWNATGVIRSRLHVTAEEIVIEDEMPGEHVETIMAEVAAMADAAKSRKDGMHLVGKLPLPIWALWRKQWQAGPRAHGVLWRAFLMGKLLDGDFSRFRVRK